MILHIIINQSKNQKNKVKIKNKVKEQNYIFFTSSYVINYILI